MVLGFLSISLANGQGQWVPLSSSPNATLTSVYFVSADTGYISSFGGKVYKTTDGGLNFSQVSNNGPAFSLCFLNARKGFGTRDNYILATQNSGNTWYSNYTNPNFMEIKNVCFPDKKHGFATALSSDVIDFVLKTNNGGTNWDTIRTQDPNYPLFQCIFFKDSLNGFIGSADGKIFKTSDGGNLWTPVVVTNISGIKSIYFPTSDTGYTATEVDGVYKTIDGGNSWNHLSCIFPSQLTSIWFTDAKHGFVGGGDDNDFMILYKTINGGITWLSCSSVAHSLNAMYFSGSMPGYAVGNEIVMKYTDPSGLDNNTFSETNFDLYPNPATKSLTIETSKNATVEIVNMQGQLVKAIPNISNKTSIDISGLQDGMYFVKLTTDEGSVVRKFVKE